MLDNPKPFEQAWSELFHEDWSFIRSSLLIQLCKDYNLRNVASPNQLNTIAKWIDSEDDELRRSVMFSLCFFRPVDGFHHIAMLGWERSDAGDAHWHVSGIESSYTDPEYVDKSTCDSIIRVLDRTAPRRSNFDDPTLEDHDNQFDFEEAMRSHEMMMRSACKVTDFIYQLVFSCKHDDIAYEDLPINQATKRARDMTQKIRTHISNRT